MVQPIVQEVEAGAVYHNPAIVAESNKRCVTFFAFLAASVALCGPITAALQVGKVLDSDGRRFWLGE